MHERVSFLRKVHVAPVHMHMPPKKKEKKWLDGSTCVRAF